MTEAKSKQKDNGTLFSQFMENVRSKNEHEAKFIQAVSEVVEYVAPFIQEKDYYQNESILQRIIEPERTVIFRVPWIGDDGKFHVNRGFRVEMNSAIGPYKGGLRFHPSVNLDALKFLAFEQIFKNSLTGLPMGAGKGGSDFDPKGKSDNEVMRFCQSFMSELFRHIGANTDVPAGDIGVGGREIGYLFGQYKRLKNEFTGVLTGKGVDWGGSLIRPEATGYGCVYFADFMLHRIGDNFRNKSVVISGSGNVAQYAAEKSIHLGAKVITLSDSSGYIHDPDGVDEDKLDFVKELKNVKRGRIKEYTRKYSNSKYFEGENPWSQKCDIALPCAIENELNKNDAKDLISNGCKIVAEGANMPVTLEGIEAFLEANVIYAPGKASNAGGVAVSGLEMSQNSMRVNWSKDEVDKRLHDIMLQIHNICVKYGKESGDTVNYVKGANIGGFVRVADAMIAQGLV
ncbi:MAG: NADP-specific glutamate dehydrogenase [Chitinophagales bacterium]|nr:NADP-specific glutamate dehydrogenase [Chitinophagales bacterium]